VINSNWHPISYVSELSQLTVQILDTAFLSYRLGEGLWTTYDVHLGLIGKRVLHFLLVLIELVPLGVTADYRFKIGAFAPTGPVDPQFQV